MTNSKKNILNDMIQFLDALYWYLDKYLDKQSKKHFWFSKGITDLGLVIPIFAMTLIGTIVVGYVFELSAWFPYMLFFSAALPLSLLIYYSIREKRIMAKRNYRKMKWVRPIAIGIYYSTYVIIVIALAFVLITKFR